MIVDEVEFNEWLIEHNKEIHNEPLDKLDEIITEQLDISDNQIECQTLRWVLDKISELMKWYFDFINLSCIIRQAE